MRAFALLSFSFLILSLPMKSTNRARKESTCHLKSKDDEQKQFLKPQDDRKTRMDGSDPLYSDQQEDDDCDGGMETRENNARQFIGYPGLFLYYLNGGVSMHLCACMHFTIGAGLSFMLSL